MDPLHETLIIRTSGEHVEETTDQVAAEIGFTLNINNKQLVTLLCTPAELDAMAIGFLLSEGILKDRESLRGVQIDENTFTVSVNLATLPDDTEKTFHKKTFHNYCFMIPHTCTHTSWN